MELQVRIYQINFSRLGKTLSQIENPDDLQSIANLTRVFCVCMTILMKEKKSVFISMYQNVQKEDIVCNRGLPFMGKS